MPVRPPSRLVSDLCARSNKAPGPTGQASTHASRTPRVAGDSHPNRKSKGASGPLSSNRFRNALTVEGCHCDRPQRLGSPVASSRRPTFSSVRPGLVQRRPANPNRWPDARQHSCVERLHHIVPTILRPQAPNDGRPDCYMVDRLAMRLVTLFDEPRSPLPSLPARRYQTQLDRSMHSPGSIPNGKLVSLRDHTIFRKISKTFIFGGSRFPWRASLGQA